MDKKAIDRMCELFREMKTIESEIYDIIRERDKRRKYKHPYPNVKYSYLSDQELKTNLDTLRERKEEVDKEHRKLLCQFESTPNLSDMDRKKMCPPNSKD